MMIDPWLPLLRKLPLSKTERDVVKRYEEDPEGRVFLPIADILRAHRLMDESLELLTQGVEKHPRFTVARVVLSRELLQKGLVTEAWRVLQESPLSLADNVLAQKLFFKLAILQGMDQEAQAKAIHIKMHQMFDAETKALIDLFELSGSAKVKAKILKEFESRGIALLLPDPQSPELTSPANVESFPAKATVSDAEAFSLSGDEQEDPLYKTSGGFHVVPLDEVFLPGDDAAGPRDSKSQSGGIELDSTTLADIFANQGHYAKALGMYRRLLRMSPQNDFLRRKVMEIAKLEKDQKQEDLTIDPEMVDQMESLEIIDRQIQFYQQLLQRLS